MSDDELVRWAEATAKAQNSEDVNRMVVIDEGGVRAEWRLPTVDDPTRTEKFNRAYDGFIKTLGQGSVPGRYVVAVGPWPVFCYERHEGVDEKDTLIMSHDGLTHALFGFVSLHLYEHNDAGSVTRVVAQDEKDLPNVLADVLGDLGAHAWQYGQTREEFVSQWRVLDDDALITMSDDEDGPKLSLTASDWCRRAGRGAVWSTEH